MEYTWLMALLTALFLILFIKFQKQIVDAGIVGLGYQGTKRKPRSLGRG